jgi:hypothetical protein
VQPVVPNGSENFVFARGEADEFELAIAADHHRLAVLRIYQEVPNGRPARMEGTENKPEKYFVEL